MVGRRKVEITEREINGMLTPGKECSRCGEWKPLDEFHKKSTGVGGRTSECRSCGTVSAGRITRIRPELESRIINGKEVLGKKCTKCGEWKPLETGFCKRPNGLGGRNSICKSCNSKSTGKFVELESKVIDGEEIVGKKCKGCGKWKPLDRYYKHTKGLGGRDSHCIECRKTIYQENKEEIMERQKGYYRKNIEKRKAYWMEYYQKNRERYLKKGKKYYQENRERFKFKKQKRRARKESLPNNWTEKQRAETWSYFNNSCALTGAISGITEEHAIPLSIGHGGTYHGNMYPMSKTLNKSKYNNNIFEWFEANKERFNLSEERFNRLIEYLATLNGLTSEEYRQFVYWCHENPREPHEIEDDPRHSIEIWREATGLHFPLPAYAIENDNMSDNERPAS